MREGDKRCQIFLGAPSGAQNSPKPLICHYLLIYFLIYFFKIRPRSGRTFFFLIFFFKNTILENVDFFFQKRQNLKNNTVGHLATMEPCLSLCPSRHIFCSDASNPSSPMMIFFGGPGLLPPLFCPLC